MYIGILVTQSCRSWQHGGIILVFVSKNPSPIVIYRRLFPNFSGLCKLSVSNNNTPKFYESLFLQKHLM